MKPSLLRMIAFSLAVLLSLCLLTPVQVSAAYENTHKNTGNQRKDIVAIALTQMGYSEGANNDTKYGDWYGMPNQPWCAMFVSWCANEAGVLAAGVFSKSARAHPANFGLTVQSGSSYSPRSGDLFFCKRNGSYAHAGIVYYVDGNYFYSIEGNSNSGGSFDGGGVCSLRRKISDCYFASPSYRGTDNCNYVQAYEAEHPHKAYYQCAHCSDKYYVKGNTTLEDCQTCIMENCEHQFGDWTQTDSGHSRSCTKCIKTETGKHSWSSKTLEQADCTKSGIREKTCKVCSAVVNETIPQSTQHKYSDWKSDDETAHSRTCSVCEKTESAAHAFTEEWLSDENGHYRQCTQCMLSSKVIAHDFSENCEAGCLECGYISENLHTFSDQFLFDAENHWNACSNCKQISQQLPHSFDNSCDTQCNDCPYTRQTEHSFSQQWFSDESDHWLECTVCKQEKDRGSHSGDSSVQDVNCEPCGYLLAHVHVYDTIQQDEENHWGVCACTAVNEAVPHQWQDSRICPVCQAEKPVELWIWILMIATPLLILAGIFLFLLIRSRKQTGRYVKA